MKDESQEKQHRTESITTVEPFNDATSHLQNIVGTPNKRVDLNTLPKPIRMFYYFFVSVIVIGVIILIFASIFK